MSYATAGPLVLRLWAGDKSSVLTQGSDGARFASPFLDDAWHGGCWRGSPRNSGARSNSITTDMGGGFRAISLRPPPSISSCTMLINIVCVIMCELAWCSNLTQIHHDLLLTHPLILYHSGFPVAMLVAPCRAGPLLFQPGATIGYNTLYVCTRERFSRGRSFHFDSGILVAMGRLVALVFNLVGRHITYIPVYVSVSYGVAERSYGDRIH